MCSMCSLLLFFCFFVFWVLFLIPPGEGNGNPLQYSLLPGKSHGWRSLVGFSPWAHTKRLFLSFFLFSYWFLTELSVARASHFWLYPYTEPASTLTLLRPSKTSHWNLKLWGFFCSYLFLIWLEPDDGSFLDLVGYLPTLRSSYFL